MSNLPRIQPQVSLIIHYTGDSIKGCYLKKTPSHFTLSAMAPHEREMSQDLRKKIISLHKKGEGYKKISKALLISQNTVAKVVQTFKKDGTATISQRRPGRPRKLTPRQERLLMRRVADGFKTVWRRKGEEYKEKCMVPTVKHGGGSVLMWGCMSAAGVGELHFIDGIMNSQMYCSILKEKMLPSLRALGRPALFQHDNDPKHTSKATDF